MGEAVDRSPIGDRSVVALSVVARSPDRATGLDRRSPSVQGQGDLRSGPVWHGQETVPQHEWWHGLAPQSPWHWHTVLSPCCVWLRALGFEPSQKRFETM